jgi:hypothetical protein
MLPCEDHERVVRRPWVRGVPRLARLFHMLGYWELWWWLSTSLLVITVYVAEGEEWSLVIVVARQDRLERS